MLAQTTSIGARWVWMCSESKRIRLFGLWRVEHFYQIYRIVLSFTYCSTEWIPAASRSCFFLVRQAIRMGKVWQNMNTGTVRWNSAASHCTSAQTKILSEAISLLFKVFACHSDSLEFNLSARLIVRTSVFTNRKLDDETCLQMGDFCATREHMSEPINKQKKNEKWNEAKAWEKEQNECLHRRNWITRIGHFGVCLPLNLIFITNSSLIHRQLSLSRMR